MAKKDLQRRIDLRQRTGTGSGASFGVSYTGGGELDDEMLVRRDGTHSLYATARWAWEVGAEVAGTLRGWGNGLIQVFGQLYAGRRAGPRVGILNYRADDEAPSYVLEAVDAENVPVFSAGALDNSLPDTAWVNIGRENYPRIHFGALAGWDRQVPLVDAELINGEIQSWQIDYSKLNPLLDHGLLQGLSDDDHPQYHTDARGDLRYDQIGHYHDAEHIYITDAGAYFASAYLEGALEECAGYFATEYLPGGYEIPRVVETSTLRVITDASGVAGIASDTASGERGFMLKMINRTGGASVKGTLVALSTATDREVIKQSNEYDTVGVVQEDGVAEGSEMWVWVNGSACRVLAKDGVAFTRGNILIAADTDGRADNVANPGSGLPAVDVHFKECGHVMESQDAGTDVLALCMLHFN